MENRIKLQDSNVKLKELLVHNELGNGTFGNVF